VARLGIQAAEALEHAHQLGVVHRDVKPGNLLVDERGSLWVADFGLAQFQNDARLTQTGDLVGTLRYMSPEQALAKRVVVDHRTDVYSLGATLYELLTLRPVFPGGDRQELLRQIAFEEPQPPRKVKRAIPAELETIVLKALEKNPADRYATAEELGADLRRFLEDRPILARRPGLAERARKWSRRHPTVVSSLAVGVLVAVALCVAFSPDGRFALSGSMDHSMRLWNVATGKQVLQFVHDARVMGVCFSPHGKWGLSNTGSGDVVLWELVTGRDLHHFKGHTGFVESVAFSPDGRQILSVGADRTARLWDVRTGKEVRRLANDLGPGFIHVALSPDGQRALTGASSGGIIQLWDVATGQELNRYLRPGGHTVQCVAFSPDGRSALSVSHHDRAVSLWPLPDPPSVKANP
jgi:hypothetical protein